MSPTTTKPADRKAAYRAALRDLVAGNRAQRKIAREAH